MSITGRRGARGKRDGSRPIPRTRGGGGLAHRISPADEHSEKSSRVAGGQAELSIAGALRE